MNVRKYFCFLFFACFCCLFFGVQEVEAATGTNYYFSYSSKKYSSNSLGSNFYVVVMLDSNNNGKFDTVSNLVVMNGTPGQTNQPKVNPVTSHYFYNDGRIMVNGITFTGLNIYDKLESPLNIEAISTPPYIEPASTQELTTQATTTEKPTEVPTEAPTEAPIEVPTHPVFEGTEFKVSDGLRPASFYLLDTDGNGKFDTFEGLIWATNSTTIKKYSTSITKYEFNSDGTGHVWYEYGDEDFSADFSFRQFDGYADLEAPLIDSIDETEEPIIPDEPFDYSDDIEWNLGFLSPLDISNKGIYYFYSLVWNLFLLYFGFELIKFFDSKFSMIFKRWKDRR